MKGWHGLKKKILQNTTILHSMGYDVIKNITISWGTCYIVNKPSRDIWIWTHHCILDNVWTDYHLSTYFLHLLSTVGKSEKKWGRKKQQKMRKYSLERTFAADNLYVRISAGNLPW